MRNLLFVDTETTGLDRQRHELIEVAAILTDPSGHQIRGRFEARMHMLRPETANAESLALNGYSSQRWADARPHLEVAKAFAELATDVTLVGQNISQDEGFLLAFLRQWLPEVAIPWHYHKLDTVSLAWPWYAIGHLPSLSLRELAAYFGIPQPKAHRAMADAETCRRLFLRIAQQHIDAICADGP